MAQQTIVEYLIDNIHLLHSTKWNEVVEQAKAMEKEQMGYTEEQAYEIWKAGQEYLKTSGSSITFQELIEKFKPKSIIQQNI